LWPANVYGGNQGGIALKSLYKKTGRTHSPNGHLTLKSIFKPSQFSLNKTFEQMFSRRIGVDAIGYDSERIQVSGTGQSSAGYFTADNSSI
jgi:hypothetical protein